MHIFKNNITVYTFFKVFFLMTADVLGYILSVFLAVKIRSVLPYIIPLDFPLFYNKNIFSPENNIFLLIIIVTFIMNNLYQIRRSFWEEILIIWKALILSFFLLYLILFNFQTIYPLASRLVIIFIFIFTITFIPFMRLLVKNILFNINFWKIPAIIVCDPEELQSAERIATVFKKDSYLGFFPIAFYTGEQTPQASLPVIPSEEEFFQHKHHMIFVAGEKLAQNKEFVASLYAKFRRIYLIPQKSFFGLIHSGVQYLFSEQLFIVKMENKLNSHTAQLIKGTMDKVLGFLIVIPCLPIILFTMIIIKCTSKGPVFYRQERIGKGGCIFKMWKFRTMYENADKILPKMLEKDPELKKEWHTYLKLKNDPRITPIGKILRKYSIDELPQLFNLISGEMSLVGPRPFVKGEITQLNPTLVPLYAQVKPGLTGLWQVSRSDTDWVKRMEIDTWYIQNWSPSLDLLILLNTPQAVLSARGAS